MRRAGLLQMLLKRSLRRCTGAPGQLRTGATFKLDGRAIDMMDPELLEAARRAARDPVGIMMNGIGAPGTSFT